MRFRAKWGVGLGLLISIGIVGYTSGMDDPSETVILVVVDTLRADHLTPYGYDVRPTTPALERWAESATLFEHAYSSSSWTLPAFGTILTGRWPSVHGAGAFLPDGEATNWSALDDAITTLPEVFGRAGYATAAIVNNLYLNERFGVARGFDHYDWRNGTDSTWRPASESVDLALDWLRRNRRRPRFLMLHLMEPHFSYNAPEGFHGHFRTAEQLEAFEVPIADGGQLGNNIGEMTDEEWDLVRAAYDEEIAYVDVQLDRFFRGLQEMGVWEDAVVILTSDHGEEFVDHGDYGHGRTMYDEVTRVPLFVWWNEAAPGRIDTPVSLADIFPTLMEAIGTEPDLPVDGVSLVDLLDGGPPPADRLLLLERNQFDAEQSQFGAVAWPHKLIAVGDQPLLFDLARDADERHDLQASTPGLTARLVTATEQMRALARRTARTARGPQLDEEDIEALRALGYIQ